MELLERDSPLKDLREWLREATAGRGRIALVSGEAGIGKTALIEGFLAEHRPEVRLLRGQCDALFTPQPLAPLYDIAHQTNGRLLELIQSADNWALEKSSELIIVNRAAPFLTHPRHKGSRS